jgi:hypothetical protein
MYRYINYGRIFEQTDAQGAQPAPKKVKSLTVDLTEAQIEMLQKAIDETSIFEAQINKIDYIDATSSEGGMLYVAIKQTGGQQSAQNTQKISQLNDALKTSTTPILIYEAEVSSTQNKLTSILELSGDPKGSVTTVIFDSNPEKTEQVNITFYKADDAAAQETETAQETPASTEAPSEPSAAEIAAETGMMSETPVGENSGANPTRAIMSFDNFVSEAKDGKWIKEVKMKKGALRKERGIEKDEKLTAKELKKIESELKKKDKDKKKPGLQLNKKDAKTHKRTVLAKNLMKASGAMNESRQDKIKGAKDQLVKIHEVIEKMIKQTSNKKSNKK